jgi:biotin-dependent carboxylase-like uncharacterized protein
MLEVLAPGALTSVQDAVGRHEWRHLGVPAGGAADPWSARLANRLVGNPDAAPLLEITHHGPVLRADAPMLVALTGRLDASIDGLPWPSGTSRSVRPGSTIRVGDGLDARGYLAIAGGIVVESVLGSAATDLRSGFGGFEGRALRAGDRLQVGVAGAAIPTRWMGQEPSGRVRIVAGPHADRLEPTALTEPTWRVSPQSDRTGVRLEGPTLPAHEGEIASIGLPAGAIQLPPGGQPIIALVDRPVTGGYPVPAVVIGADLGRVGRLRPGDELRFALVSIAEARIALQDAFASLGAIEPLSGPGDDDAGWAGLPG